MALLPSEYQIWNVYYKFLAVQIWFLIFFFFSPLLMLECSSVWWDLYCGKSEWAFSWSISSARGSPVRGGTSMAAPEAGRGFSHCRTHLRSRHNGHQKPTWDYSIPSEMDLYHISPFAHPASWAAALHPHLSLNSDSPQKTEVNPNPEESLPSLPPCLAFRPELLGLLPSAFSPSERKMCICSLQARGLSTEDLHRAPGDPRPISDSGALYWVTSGKSQTCCGPLSLKMAIVIAFCLPGARSELNVRRRLTAMP